jgi:hypothetical protein
MKVIEKKQNHFAKCDGDRCNVHNFRRFLPIFGEKIGFFSKTNVMIKIFAKTGSILSKKGQFYCHKNGENIFKIPTSVPGRGSISENCISKLCCQKTKPV